MTFNSYTAVLFMVAVLILYHAIRHRKAQNLFLLFASFGFYAYGEPVFVALLVGCIFISYSGAIWMHKFRAKQKPILVACITVLLIILGIFKYYNFFVDSAYTIFAAIGLPFQMITLQIALPIAISFYTFQSIGYLIDVYRDDVAPETSLVDYALFVSYFPQLVAGPIERSTNLLKQIKNDRSVTQKDITYGTYLILQGFVKKVVIADNLAPIVDGVLQNPTLGGPIIAVAMLGFAFQIYCDFSGYTDIARGISRLLGIRIVLNFNHPYVSKSLTEFWRRWHMSLSNWFRDYVYISLGGSRTTVPRMHINLLITMTVSGLWHGASANFILWGFYHGLFLVAHKTYLDYFRIYFPEQWIDSRLYVTCAWALTFVVTLYGWMLFRVESFDQITSYTVQLFSNWSHLTVALLLLSQIGIFVVIALAVDFFENRYLDIESSEMRSTKFLPIYFAALFSLVVLLGVEGSGDFIYFRF